MSGTSACRRMGAIGAVMLAIVMALAMPAAAQIGSDRYSALVVEARTGALLVAANPDEPRYPASLTKMMTIYMAFEALRAGRVQLSTPVPVSYSSAAMAPSKLGLEPGTTLTVEEAILAMVTKSANDAAASLGELLGGGSEDRFAQMMTLRARSLGMRNTTFRNASGLPDFEQMTTARDMTLLGQRLVRDFPERYGLFATPYFSFRGRTLFNHNRLLQEYDGADGIKTGYVDDSGFNLVASAQRDGVRLVAAVFGGRTGRERDRHMMALLDQGFTAMGIATREPAVAQRGLSGLMGNAQAATIGRGWTARQMRDSTPRSVAFAHTPAQRRALAKAEARETRREMQADTRKGGLLRLAGAKDVRGRAEQGDSSRAVAALPRPPAHVAPPGKAAGKAAPKVADKPVKTASNTRRAG